MSPPPTCWIFSQFVRHRKKCLGEFEFSSYIKENKSADNVYRLQKRKRVDTSLMWGHLWGFSCIFLVGLPSGPCLERGSGVLSYPQPLPQKGCTPHPTGTARVITHGQKSWLFPKLSCSQAKKGEGSQWAVPNLCPGICWARSRKSQASFSHQNKTSQIPWPF